MKLVESDCPECRSPKTVIVALSSDCGECGLDSFGITYDIPAEKVDAVIHAIFDVFDANHLRPRGDRLDIPTYEELLKRLGI